MMSIIIITHLNRCTICRSYYVAIMLIVLHVSIAVTVLLVFVIVVVVVVEVVCGSDTVNMRIMMMAMVRFCPAKPCQPPKVAIMASQHL